MINIASARKEGEARIQVGMMLSAERRAELVAKGQVAILQAALNSEDGTATVDNATTDLSASFDNGGKWRGSVPSRLARCGIIQRVGDRKSDRPSRHRGYVSIWRLVNRDLARQEIVRLSAMLNTKKEIPQAAATDCGQIESTIIKPTLKDL